MWRTLRYRRTFDKRFLIPVLTTFRHSSNVEHMSNPDLMTTRQVAERLKRSRRTIDRWADSGELPAAMVFEGLRGPRLFKRSVVEAKAAELHAMAPALPEAG